MTDELSLAAALLIIAAVAILIVCGVMALWSWAAERVFDRVFGAMEDAIRWLASRR